MFKNLLSNVVLTHTTEDIYLQDLLRHMLGAWLEDEERALWGRRNYFMTGPGRVDDALRRLLVEGMVRVGSGVDGQVRVYHATSKGCSAIGLDANQTRRALETAHQVEICRL